MKGFVDDCGGTCWGFEIGETPQMQAHVRSCRCRVCVLKADERCFHESMFEIFCPMFKFRDSM